MSSGCILAWQQNSRALTGTQCKPEGGEQSTDLSQSTKGKIFRGNYSPSDHKQVPSLTHPQSLLSLAQVLLMSLGYPSYPSTFPRSLPFGHQGGNFAEALLPPENQRAFPFFLQDTPEPQGLWEL